MSSEETLSIQDRLTVIAERCLSDLPVDPGIYMWTTGMHGKEHGVRTLFNSSDNFEGTSPGVKIGGIDMDMSGVIEIYDPGCGSRTLAVYFEAKNGGVEKGACFIYCDRNGTPSGDVRLDMWGGQLVGLSDPANEGAVTVFENALMIFESVQGQRPPLNV